MEASRSIFSSRFYAEQACASSKRCKLLFLQKTILALRRPEVVGHRWPARPERAALAATASGQNRTSAMSEANGGAERDRTADPLLAKQVLSQLSYSPNTLGTASADKRQHKARSSTPYPQSSFSQIQPQTRSSTCKSRWWAREDLNFRPHAYQACALTN